MSAEKGRWEFESRLSSADGEVLVERYVAPYGHEFRYRYTLTDGEKAIRHEFNLTTRWVRKFGGSR